MPTVLEEAAGIVAQREYLYDIIVADLYYMAQLAGDRETQHRLWQEAWGQGNDRLLMLLLLADMHLDYSLPM